MAQQKRPLSVRKRPLMWKADPNDLRRDPVLFCLPAESHAESDGMEEKRIGCFDFASIGCQE